MSKKLTTKIFIEKAVQVHNNKYDYSLVEYKNIKTKVKIICSIHGIFEQTPNNHPRGNGCPKCNDSKGENNIIQVLKKYKIDYIFQKRFKDCKNKYPLPFDFYLPKYNLCIEYEGKQHFEEIKYWGGIKRFKYIKQNDEIKNNYCKTHNIPLFRIAYFNNIENKLQELFNNMQIKEALLGNNTQNNSDDS